MDGMSGSHRMGSRVSLAIALGIGVALTGCSSYGSRTEARMACNKWKKEGPRFRHTKWTYKPTVWMYSKGTPEFATPDGETESTTRSCETEEATKQVLGWVRYPPKGWDHVYPDGRMLGWERVVSKRFRWPSR